MIYILAGAIRSGKTTALQNWVKGRVDVDGFLCPDDNNGKRYFLNVKSGEDFELESASETADVVVIGPFRFLKSAFKKANDLLVSFSSETENRYIIFDELGKLELRNEGLYRSAETLISKFMLNETQHLILVVRDYLLSDIIESYHISEYSVIEKEDLKTLN